MRTILTFMLACIAPCSVIAADIATEGSDTETREPGSHTSFEIERYSWVGKVPAKADQCDCNITVLNNFGTVRARFGGYQGRVEVFANIQHFAEEETRLIIDSSESAAGVEVTVAYPDGANGNLITARDENKKRADLVVWVPHGVSLIITTDQDLIDTRGLKSDVRAHSSSGSINATKTQGTLHFETSSGNIFTLLEHWDTKHDHVFSTVSGEQTISFGSEVDTRISVATNGLISSDYSINIDYDAHRQPVKRAEALIGSGSSTVTTSSSNGHIRLVRQPLAREAGVYPEAGN